MNNYWVSTTWRDDADGKPVAGMVVCRTPVLWDLLETVVAEWGCALTRHRWCTSRPLMAIRNAAEDRTDSFTVPISVEDGERFHRWRGWPRPIWLGLLDDDEGE